MGVIVYNNYFEQERVKGPVEVSQLILTIKFFFSSLARAWEPFWLLSLNNVYVKV